MRIVIPPGALAAFEADQAERGRDEVEAEHDAFCVFGGTGPCRYITRDGRFLIGADEMWDEPITREGSDADAIAILRIAARRFALDALVDLIPARPADVPKCAECEGTGLAIHLPMICHLCSGLGWGQDK